MKYSESSDFSAVAAGTASLGVFLATLSPTLYTGDAGELITAAVSMGIPHPPGYPLYCILGRLFAFLPISDFACRLNLMSAFFGAAATVVLYLLVNLVYRKPSAAFLCALWFSFSSAFWNQAIQAEVYTLNAFFFGLAVYLLLLFHRTNSMSILKLLAFVCGLGLANHHTMLLSGSVIAGYLIWYVVRGDRPAGRTVELLAGCTGFLFLGLLVYLYIPVRSLAQPEIDWGNPGTLKTFFKHVLRQQYGPIEQVRHSFGLLFHQSLMFLKLLSKQFTPAIAVFMPFGLLKLYRHNRQYFFIMVSFFLAASAVFTVMLNPRMTPVHIDSWEIFLIPAFLVSAVFLGGGIILFSELFPRQSAGNITLSLCLLFPLISLKSNFFENNQSRNRLARDFGSDLLSTLEPGSALFSDGDLQVFTLAYLSKIEKLRTDVSIYDNYGWIFTNIYGKDFSNLPAFEQNRRSMEIQEDFAGRSSAPVYFTLMKISGLRPAGLLGRSVKPGEPPDQKDYWNSYRIKAPYSFPFYLDRHNRELLSQYHFFKAQEFRFKNKIENAIAELRSAGTLAYDSISTKSNISMLYTQMGLNDLAIEEGKSSAEIDDQNVEGLNNLAVGYCTQKRYDEAEKIFENIIRINPFYAPAYSNLARIYEEKGLQDKLIAAYRKVIELNPANADVLLHLGLALHRQKNYSEAIDCYYRALTLSPDNADSNYNLGVALIESKRIPEAENRLRTFLNKFPADSRTSSVRQWLNQKH